MDVDGDGDGKRGGALGFGQPTSQSGSRAARHVFNEGEFMDTTITSEPRGDAPQGIGSSLIGTYVIVRSSQSGVWAGTLACRDGDTVELTDARRLSRWWAAKGVSLSGVAAHGLNPSKLSECRIAAPVSRALVIGAFEVLSTSDEALKSINGAEALAS